MSVLPDRDQTKSSVISKENPLISLKILFKLHHLHSELIYQYFHFHYMINVDVNTMLHLTKIYITDIKKLYFIPLCNTVL